MNLTPTSVDVAAHPPWCESSQCTAGYSDFHPAALPPAHRSRLYPCNPEPGLYITGLAAQLVQFIGDPTPATLLRLEFADVDTRQSFYVMPRQAEALAGTVATLLAHPPPAAALPGRGPRDSPPSSPDA